MAVGATGLPIADGRTAAPPQRAPVQGLPPYADPDDDPPYIPQPRPACPGFHPGVVELQCETGYDSCPKPRGERATPCLPTPEYPPETPVGLEGAGGAALSRMPESSDLAVAGPTRAVTFPELGERI